MDIEFINVLEFAVAFIGLLFAIYFLLDGKYRKTSNVFISFFLVLLSSNLSHFYSDHLYASISANFQIFMMLSAFFLPASLYIYTKSSIDISYRFKGKELLHLLPLVFVNLLLIWPVYRVNFYELEVPDDYSSQFDFTLYILFYLLFLVYFILSFRFIKQSRKVYSSSHSGTDVSRFKYLYRFNVLASCIFAYSALKNIFLVNSTSADMVEVSAYLILLLFLMFFLWIINKAVRSPELFVDDRGHASFREDSKAYHVLSTIRSNDEDQLAMAEELERQMKKEKPFLNPSLSIQELSEGLSYSTRDLSGLLNSYFKKHFFEYVNDYRIEEAKSMLLDPAYKKTTVLEILYAVGFNSKSSFNTAFKKITGFTPTEYRKAHL